MTKAAVEVLALIFLLLLAGVLGYGYRGDRNQEAITTASSNYATCKSALDGKQAAVTELQTRLTDLKQRHDNSLTAAEATLAGRDATIAELTAAAEKRTTTIRKLSHEDADCASLDHLAVCASVAGQLWPVPQQATTTAGDHAH